MSNKLSKKELDLLIERMLSEDISVSVKQTKDNIEKDLGVPKNTAKKDKYVDLAGLDNPDQILDDDDFEKAFAYKSNYKGRKALATNIYNKSSKKGEFKYKPTGATGDNLTLAQLKIKLKLGTIKNEYKIAIISEFTAGRPKNAQKLLDALKDLYPAKPGTGTAYAQAAKAIGTPAAAGTEQYKVALQRLTKALDALEFGKDYPVSDPKMYSQPAASGKFAAELISSFDTVFNLTPACSTIEDRVKRISEMSIAMVSDNKSNLPEKLSFIKPLSGNKKKRALLSCILVLDYIAAFAKYFDHGSGGYLYEAFCALITGGEVVGKDMGSGDFTIKDSSGKELRGSSKYYRSGSTMKQATSGFKKNTTTTYIVVQKEQKRGGTRKDRATSDPSALVYLDIYLGDVTFGSKVNASNMSSTGGLKFTFGSSEITITAPVKKNYATIQLAKNKSTSYINSLEATIKRSNKKMQDVYKLFKAFFEKTRNADSLTKQFMSTGKKATGTQALSNMKEADEAQVALINDIRGEGQKAVGAIGTGKRALEENKQKSKKDLDKLIKEVILNKSK